LLDHGGLRRAHAWRGVCRQFDVGEHVLRRRACRGLRRRC
jgi:hypothetical protein